jgi:hypothetical protein
VWQVIAGVSVRDHETISDSLYGGCGVEMISRTPDIARSGFIGSVHDSNTSAARGLLDRLDSLVKTL